MSALPGDGYYQLTGFTVLCLTAGGIGKPEIINGPRLCPNVWLRPGCSVVMFIDASQILTDRNGIFTVKLIIKNSAMRDG